jgi:H+-transporting ATPase
VKFGPKTSAQHGSASFRPGPQALGTPDPWIAEAAIVLDVVLGKYVETAIISAFLAFNSVLGFFPGTPCQSG